MVIERRSVVFERYLLVETLSLFIETLSLFIEPLLLKDFHFPFSLKTFTFQSCGGKSLEGSTPSQNQALLF